MNQQKNQDEYSMSERDIAEKIRKAKIRNTVCILGVVFCVIVAFLVNKIMTDTKEDYIDGNVMKLANTNYELLENTIGYPWRSSTLIGELTYASLFETDSSFTDVNPDLAESIESSNNGRTYTITLKDDLNWSDGTPLTMDDVVFSIESFLLSMSSGYNVPVSKALTKIDGVEEWQKVGQQSWKDGGTHSLKGLSVNGNVLTINLTAPYSEFSVALSQFIILPKHCLEDIDPTTFNDINLDFYVNPTCFSGMYKLDSIDEEGNATFIQNENYHRTISDIEKVVLYTDYHNMHLDYWTTNNISDMVSYRAISKYSEYDVDVEWYRYFVFNLNNGYQIPDMVPQLDEDGNQVKDENGNIVMVEELIDYSDREPNYAMQDIKVRQAISLAINRAELAKDVYLDAATYDFASTGNPEYSEFLSDYNPDLAKQLLAESDYDLTRPLVLGYYHTDSKTAIFMEQVKVYLEEIGFKVIVKQQVGAAALYEQTEYDLYLKAYPAYTSLDWYNEYVSSNEFLYGLMGCDGFDELLIALEASTTQEEYVKAMADLQELDRKTMYKLPLVSLDDVVFINSERVSIHEDMIFGNVRYRSALHLDEWSIKKG